MVPLARALRDAGHRVAFATARQFHPRVTHAGFEALAAGMSEAALEQELRRRLPDRCEVPVEQQRTRMATEIAPSAMLPDLLRLIDEWRPDLIIHEEGELTAPLAAALAAIPSVTHGWPAPAITAERGQRIGAALAPLWRERGLEAPPLAGLFRRLHLDPCPPSLQGPRLVDGPKLLLRPVAYDSAPESEVPDWLRVRSVRPTVYLTLGTVPAFNRAPELFNLMLQSLREDGLDLIVTVGPNNDPQSLGRQPGNVHVERYVPQSLVLPRCQLVVCHGGASSTAAALAHGLPILFLPRGGASQMRCAEACAARGIGRVLLDGAVTADAMRREVGALLGEARYKEAATQVAAEIRAMPAPGEAVETLEQVAARG
jgi:UDP:flavonoid glycosyltransferase YjiC (YdhE family)